MNLLDSSTFSHRPFNEFACFRGSVFGVTSISTPRAQIEMKVPGVHRSPRERRHGEMKRILIITILTIRIRYYSITVIIRI